MKKVTILMLGLVMILSQACAQTQKNVPTKVKTTFAQKFPNAKKVKWDKENATEWEAEFKMKGKEYSANFDNNGNWKETEYRINKSDIPSAVKSTLDKNFNGYKIEVAEVSETADGKVYEFMIEKGNSDMEVVVNSDGKLVKKEEKKEKDEDEEADEENDND